MVAVEKLKRPSSRYRFTTWVALADFFAALALTLFVMFASQRSKTIRIEQPMKEFVQRLEGELRLRGIPVRADIDKSAIILPEGALFGSTRWDVDPNSVRGIAEALKVAAQADTVQELQLVIRGHADARPIVSKGGFENIQLSRLRARTMEEGLARNGVQELIHISSEGVGAREPVVDNCAVPAQPGTKLSLRVSCPDGRYGTAEALERNRRIELRFGFFSGQTVLGQ